MLRAGITKSILYQLLVLFPAVPVAQTLLVNDTAGNDIYYVGINPIAPFTSIRGEVTSLYLPALSNLETGVAVFAGKIWNRNYNVETRLSFGSPEKGYQLLQVQSGLLYCFRKSGRNNYFYTGMFINLRSLHKITNDVNYTSAIAYISAGKRFVWNRYFIDVRLNQNICALSWTSLPEIAATAGFHPSIYKWKSAYVPSAGVGIGYFFR